MAADKKSSANIDKIDDIETQVKTASNTEEEKVISIHIPRRSSEKSESSTKVSKESSVELEEIPVEPKAEPKAESQTPNTSNTTQAHTNESVSSFSLLDADKNNEEKTSDNTLMPEKAPVAEVSEPKVHESTTESNESLDNWLEEAEPSTMTDMPSTIEPEQKGGKLKAFIIALLVVMILGAIGGGIYYYTTRVSNQDTTPEVPSTDLPTPTFTPTPTEVAEAVELSEYTVEVLNGSGVAGQAGVIASLLEEEGFSTADAANADSQSYTDTLVSMKADTPEGVFTELERILGNDYVLEMSSDTLDEDSEYDVQVILGSSEPEESEEETTPTPTVEEEPGI